MKRFLIAVLATSAVAAAPTALAANPHWVKDPDCVQTSTTTLTCSGKAAGLGNLPLFVVVNAPAGCTVKSGANNPPGQQSFVSGPFDTSNGQFTFGPGTGNNVTAQARSCPGTQTPFIVNSAVTVSIYECSSGSPTFSRKTGQQTNNNCKLVLGPTPA